MFNSKIFNPLTILALIVFFNLTLIAQPPMGQGMGQEMKGGPGGKGMHQMNCLPKQDREDLRNSIKEYKDQNICPQFTDWKAKIDASLKTEDLSKLNQLRAEAAKIKAERDSNRSQMREKIQSGNFSRADMKEMRNEMKSQMKDIFEQLKPIAENNKDLIKSIGEEAKTKGETWKSDIKGIFSAWAQKYADDIKNCPNFSNKDHFRFDGMKNDGKRFMIAVLLFNGNCDEMNQFGEGPMMDNPADNGAVSISNYPNPFNSSTTITFTLPTDVNNVILTVESGSGEIISTLFSGKLNAGEHSFNFVPASNLAPGAYFYKLQGDGIKETGKMLLQK